MIYVFLGTIIALSLIIYFQKNKEKKLEDKLQKYDAYKDVFEDKDRAVQMLKEAETYKEQNNELVSQRNKEFEDYKSKTLKDIDRALVASKVEAEKILVNAKIEARTFTIENEKKSAELESLKSKIVDETKNEIKKTLDDAKEKAKQLESKAQEKAEIASLAAEKMIELAQVEANSLKEGAVEFQRNHNNLTGVIKALENTVKGYGDQYFLSTVKIIEELGMSYSHIQAGKDLLVAKNLSESLINNNLAASCDYAEPERRKTAIEFVLSAFLGKFDSLISSTKKKDYGTLSQELTDSFHMINKNGAAFRNARITDVFLKSKLDEIKFLCIIHAYKEEEKEEQRAVKEQMRDEEKAIREIEKAVREAEEEEKKISKIMAKLRSELEAASEQEKGKYEEKMRDLQNQLQEAEEKNKRALSMAQQTRSGTVYIISNIGAFGENVYKIGMTRRLNAQDRVDELGDASVPFDFDVHATIKTEDAPTLEKMLHKIFNGSQLNKVNPRKEFFKIDIEKIKSEVEKLGHETVWTMKADAHEYRESLYLEKLRKEEDKAA